MQASVIVFPGSNCDRDVAICLEAATGKKPNMVWHGDSDLPDSDVIVLPGGFSYGDYLRCGSMAANSPIMKEVVLKAQKGAAVLGICNGFQVLTECGLLPGVLMRNAALNFVCRNTRLIVDNNTTPFTGLYQQGEEVIIPVAHNEGNYLPMMRRLTNSPVRGGLFSHTHQMTIQMVRAETSLVYTIHQVVYWA